MLAAQPPDPSEDGSGPEGAASSHLLGCEGYSRFFAGDFIREPGQSRESDFLYGALQYTF